MITSKKTIIKFFSKSSLKIFTLTSIEKVFRTTYVLNITEV